LWGSSQVSRTLNESRNGDVVGGRVKKYESIVGMKPQRLVKKSVICAIRISRNPKVKRVMRRCRDSTAATLATGLANQVLFHKAQVTPDLVADFISCQTLSVAFEIIRIIL